MNLRSRKKALDMKVKLCPVSGAYGLGRDSNASQGKYSQRDCTSDWMAMELSSAFAGRCAAHISSPPAVRL